MSCTSADDALIGQHIIVLQRMIDKMKIFWTLVFLLVTSPFLGALVDLCSNNANLGLAVSAGAFRLVTALQELASWMHG